VLLLCVKVSIRVFDDVFQFVVRCSYVFIERFSVVPSEPRVCTVQVYLQYNSVVLVFVYPVLRRGPHIGLSYGIAAVNWYIIINRNVVSVGVCA